MKDKSEFSVTKEGDVVLRNPSELRTKAILIVAKKLAEKNRKEIEESLRFPRQGGI